MHVESYAGQYANNYNNYGAFIKEGASLLSLLPILKVYVL